MEYQKEWRIKNAEHWLQYHRNYRNSNREKIRAYDKYYSTTEQRQKYLKEYRRKNRKKLNKYQVELYHSKIDHFREYHQKYREENREKIRAYNREWQKKKRKAGAVQHDSDN